MGYNQLPPYSKSKDLYYPSDITEFRFKIVILTCGGSTGNIRFDVSGYSVISDLFPVI